MMRQFWQVGLLALLVACSSDAGVGNDADAHQDTGLDAGDIDNGSADATPDAAFDTSAESDTEPGSGAADAIDDSVDQDAIADSGADTSAEDTTADTAPDVAEDTTADATASLLLTSPVMVDGGTLPARHTCDDAGLSPPLSWSGIPDGTGALVLLATTIARDGTKWNWVIFNLSASQTELAEGQTDAGTFGRTSDGPALAYAPPCSQGPGEKFYTFTLYAVDAPLSFSGAPSTVTGDVVEAALVGHVLAQSGFTVGYTRPIP
jgi:phosphatidylethanolamine-binding protein (PEBP) family uncharacterized protein